MTRQPWKPTARDIERLRERERFGLRYTGSPQPGWFKLRLVKGGVEIAALIYRPCPMVPTGLLDTDADPADWCRPLDRSRPLAALVNGEPGDVDRVWTSGKRIERAEYLWLLADRQWAARHAPHLPEAAPRRRVDLSTLELPF